MWWDGMIWNEMIWEWHDMKWDDMGWHEMTWDGVRWHEIKWYEMKLYDMGWNWMKCDAMWWYEMAWHDMTWHCMTHMTWHDMAWHDTTWHDMTWHEMKWDEMMWDEMKWGDKIWYEMIWYGMKWDDMKLDGTRCYEMRWDDMRWNDMNEMTWDERAQRAGDGAPLPCQEDNLVREPRVGGKAEPLSIDWSAAGTKIPTVTFTSQASPATRKLAHTPMYDERLARPHRYEPPSEFPLNLPFTSIVHHLSGPNRRAHNQTSLNWLVCCWHKDPSSHLHFASRFNHPWTCIMLDSLVRVSTRVGRNHLING